MKAYIIEGFLYGQDISGALSLSDRSGKTVYEKLLSVPGYDNPGLGKFVAYEGDQPCLIKPGEWTLVCSGQRIPVVCVGMHRVAVHTADNGKPLTFTDDIYPVIMGEGEGGLVITIKRVTGPMFPRSFWTAIQRKLPVRVSWNQHIRKRSRKMHLM